jgi:hypothetical protein
MYKNEKQCLNCRYYWGLMTCLAFPESRIPEEIWNNDFWHHKKHPLQKNKVTFAPREERKKRKIDWR